MFYCTALGRHVVDAKGRLVPDAAVVVSFKAVGDGELAAVGTGDPADAGSFYTGVRGMLLYLVTAALVFVADAGSLYTGVRVGLISAVLPGCSWHSVPVLIGEGPFAVRTNRAANVLLGAQRRRSARRTKGAPWLSSAPAARARRPRRQVRARTPHTHTTVAWAPRTAPCAPGCLRWPLRVFTRPCVQPRPVRVSVS